MGQKLSDLRGVVLTMEADEEGSRRRKEEDDLAGVDNGNEGEVDHPFELIYSNRNEPSTSSASPDELNGNVQELHCSCAGKSKTSKALSRKRTEDASLGTIKRNTFRTMSFAGGKKTRSKRGKDQTAATGTKKRSNWALRLNCARLRPDADLPDPVGRDNCVCTGYRRTTEMASPPVIDLARFNPEDFPIEDCDERARLERAREMAEGVEPPPGFASQADLDNLTMLFNARLGLHALSALSNLDVGLPSALFQRTHSQADFIHCLVPDLLEITVCSYYWGKMDRYEAERLLEGRPEGTFLLRDSAQEEILFSVSFRKYGRSLHARIEQWNHRFSFDSHDPGVYASPTVIGLIEHYKDSSLCMFFEPMLTIPLHRNFPFPLQHLCRAAICNNIDYDSISKVHLPKALKSYLREYHYKQRVRVRNLDTEL